MVTPSSSTSHTPSSGVNSMISQVTPSVRGLEMAAKEKVGRVFTTSDFNVQFCQLTELRPRHGATRSSRQGPNKLERQRGG